MECPRCGPVTWTQRCCSREAPRDTDTEKEAKREAWEKFCRWEVCRKCGSKADPDRGGFIVSDD